MSKKIDKEEFLNRFYNSNPTDDIEIISYTAISNPCEVKCKKCGKIHYKPRARDFLKNYHCCTSSNETKYERLQKIYQNLDDFELIKKVNKDFIIVKHLVCGNENKRSLQSCLDNPSACVYCQTYITSQKNSIEEEQLRLDNHFGEGRLKILTYNGQLYQNTYKCARCGFIFKTSAVSILKSRGCPKCDRKQSKGEQFIANLLQKHGIHYAEQVRLQGLNRQPFDFAVYDDDHNLQYLIEVQGDQHFIDKDYWEGLTVVQQRDEKKRNFCKEKNIQLYELEYIRGQFKNLDILPFI